MAAADASAADVIGRGSAASRRVAVAAVEGLATNGEPRSYLPHFPMYHTPTSRDKIFYMLYRCAHLPNYAPFPGLPVSSLTCYVDNGIA